MLEAEPDVRKNAATTGEESWMSGVVVAVSRSKSHTISKRNELSIRLTAGLGVDGDAHQGVTVKHRYHVSRDPTQPNLRQVHLIHAELHEELRAQGFDLAPGQMGENVTTRGIDLLHLPEGTRLHLGETAVVEIKGLRSPCTLLNKIAEGLMAATLDTAPDGSKIRKSGVMGVVLADGDVRAGDAIRVEMPPVPHRKLEKV
jgi:MOSC domain-containing protein YiiM